MTAGSTQVTRARIVGPSRSMRTDALASGVTSFHLRPLIRVIIEGVDPRDTQWEVDQRSTASTSGTHRNAGDERCKRCHRGAMADEDIMTRISALVDEEHQLRSGSGTDSQRLGELETQLDQCWDLLRQRRAKREFGESESEAQVRPPETVEKYLS